jgi:hypothetical protein
MKRHPWSIALLTCLAACSGPRSSAVDHARGAETLTTLAATQPTFALNADITIRFAGMSGGASDWIGLFPVGAGDDEWVRRVYTQAALDGTATLRGIADPGTYVARAFFGSGGTAQAESAPFAVASLPTVSTSKWLYAVGAAIDVSFSDFAGSATEWVGIFPVGAADGAPVASQSTVGATAGTLSFGGLPVGSYTARGFSDSTQRQAESEVFDVVVPPTLTLSKAAYASGETVTIAFVDMPGTADDWIGIYPQGQSDDMAYLSFNYTGGAAAGTLSFEGLPDGAYVARAFAGDGFVREAESAPFTVGLESGGAAGNAMPGGEPTPPAVVVPDVVSRSRATARVRGDVLACAFPHHR